MNRVFVVALVCAFLLLGAAPSQAQRVADHSGFWISTGLGGGLVLGDDFFEDDSRFGGVGFIRLGGTPDPQFLVGADLVGWAGSEGDTDVWRGNVLATLLYYPSDRGGFFLKGGAGFAGRSSETTILLDVDGDLMEATIREEKGGIGLGAGLGYDIQLARNFFLTPSLDYLFNGADGDTASVLAFSLGATWH